MVFIFYLAVITTGCSSRPERNLLPESLSDAAVIPGIENARYWADQPPPETDDWLKLSTVELKQHTPPAMVRRTNALRFQVADSEVRLVQDCFAVYRNRSRPEFTMVTGISTGALIAPLAFLGPEYDQVI